MLSKHAERCRFPHGHSRRIDVVLSARELNSNDMVIDFQAISLALKEHVDLFDHAMAINSKDPMAAQMVALAPDGVVVFEETDPTTEVIARDLFETFKEVLGAGWSGKNSRGVPYSIPAGAVTLEKVRVWETETTWAEYGDE